MMYYLISLSTLKYLDIFISKNKVAMMSEVITTISTINFRMPKLKLTDYNVHTVHSSFDLKYNSLKTWHKTASKALLEHVF